MSRATVIGAGPAGLMAAEQLARSGCRVTVVDQMPSPARKFLMAGKSGLNLTKAEPRDDFLTAFTPLAPQLRAALERFGPPDVIAWAEELGQPVFTGSTGRVFPVAMKASPLLRAWLTRLDRFGVRLLPRWSWSGWSGDDLIFETPQGRISDRPDLCVLALGGASWSRLGSDGRWVGHLEGLVRAFQPANAGLRVSWSHHMAQRFGAPLKGIALRAGQHESRGEIVISAAGLEGGGLYPLTPALRAGAPLVLDLLPDLSEEKLRFKLRSMSARLTFSNRLRRLGLTGAKAAIAQEFARGAEDLASALKAISISHDGVAPLDQAISTAGGVRFDAVDPGLMLLSRPGVFVAGEMLDWEAPTGGYLLTGCLATGRHAGQAASAYLARS